MASQSASIETDAIADAAIDEAIIATSTVNSSLRCYDHRILSGTRSGQLRMLLDVSVGRNTRFEDAVQSHSVVSYLGVE
jgi:hypothetical protein